MKRKRPAENRIIRDHQARIRSLRLMAVDAGRRAEETRWPTKKNSVEALPLRMMRNLARTNKRNDKKNRASYAKRSPRKGNKDGG